MISQKPHILVLILLSLLVSGSFKPIMAQEMGKPILHNYSPRDYKASSANYKAVQDRRGLLYFANLRGILEFDGTSWRVINLPNRSNVRSLATDSTGRVYVGAIGDFGYLGPDSLGKMKFNSLLPQAGDISDRMLNSQVVALGIEKGAFFYFLGDNSYYKWEEGKLTRLTMEGIPQDQIFSLYYLDSKLFLSSNETGLKLVNGQADNTGGKKILDKRIILKMTHYDDQHYLALTNTYEFWLINKATLEARRFRTEIDKSLESQVVSGFVRLRDSNILVSTIRNGAILLDPNGKELTRLDESNGLQDRLVINTFQDRQGGVWLCLSKGITYLGMSVPLEVWDESNGLEGLVFSVVRFQGYLYASTAQGVFRLVGNRFEKVENINFETHQLKLTSDGTGKQLLLASTVMGLFEVKGSTGYAIKNKKGSPIIGRIQSSRFHDGIVYINDAARHISVLKHIRGKWQVHSQLASINGRFEQIVEESPSHIWLLERYGNQRALRLTLDPSQSFEVVDEQSFNQTETQPAILSIFRLQNQLVFYTQRGFFTLDEGQNFNKLNIPNLPQYGISSLMEGEDGKVFIGRMENNRRWLEILVPGGESSYRKDSVSLRELDNLDIWGNVFLEKDGKTWIGTSEGLYCYHQDKAKVISDFPLPVIRKVKVGEDSVIFHGTDYQDLESKLLFEEPQLSHRDNAITFYFSAPYFGANTLAEYRYKLEGQDEEWSAWTYELKKDYTLLPPGQYEFQVMARNQFHQESGITAYTFEVSPPWWKSVWAFICYGFFAVFLVYGTVKINTQRLYLQNEHLERLVYERTNEIWEQHKEIVKKTVALKRKNEEIASQHDLLEDKNSELEDAMKKLQAAQTQLVESEKMASLGQLTAGIAHEINNPINYVKGNINPLKKDFDEIKLLFRKILKLKDKSNLEQSVTQIEDFAEEIDAPYLFEEMEQLLNGIEDGANRTKQIVDGLKIFSRTEHDIFKHVDVHKGIDSTLTLLNNRLKDRININRDYDELPLIECLPGKLNQVFMNIIVNSIQAIEDQARNAGKNLNQEIGEISIQTKATQNCLPGKQDCLQIFITDSGGGIPEKIRNKIFDPFFTTKDVGEGTGLGLSITFGIIEKHQGRIKVESKEGEGTTFVIILPFKQEEDAK